MNEKNYITPNGHKKLLEEFENLKKIERPKIVELVSWAASLGDRSENADYIYGKKRLREIDSRLSFLQKRLDLAVIVDPSQTKSDKIQFGASVTIDDGDTQKTFMIVGIDETDSSKGHISWKSPIGASLLGKEEGDTIIVKSPSKEVEYEIIKVCY